MVISRRFVVGAPLLGIGLLSGAIAMVSYNPHPVAAQGKAANFPDTKNYWAQPFIAALAERNIVTGYPDGTYRPNQTVDRDEFAAIVRKAFSQQRDRQIPSGSAFKDVPKGNWAAPAIEEAYETGFMSGYPSGNFRPQQPVSRVEALVSLARNLSLKDESAANRTPAAAAIAANKAQAKPTAAQPSNRPARRQIVLPFAALALMQPFVTPRSAQAAPASAPSASTPVNQKSAARNSANTQQSAAILKQYYTDANRIPKYAVSSVAEATRSGIVVNYPNRKVLNPTQPATRGEIAAFMHQALVDSGKIQPLPQNQAAAKYVVRPEAN
ncbi:MAG: S-layer homology domain-containing protein [Myxacorys chilensis ATA2-1-KO14]|jgi:hypothetical protein|nr:S-layer homology domain-containing protein [Myxacorys chilensis ATA2-1-KO14]